MPNSTFSQFQGGALVEVHEENPPSQVDIAFSNNWVYSSLIYIEIWKVVVP